MPAGQRFPLQVPRIMLVLTVLQILIAFCHQPHQHQILPVEYNPVPIPGAYAAVQQPFYMDSQKRIPDFFTHHSVCEGEGCQGSTSLTRAADWEQIFLQQFAKSGTPLPEDSGPQQRTRPFTTVQKRSYKRACKRTLLHGSTWYHGKIFTPQDFPKWLLQKMQTRNMEHPVRHDTRPHAPRADRLRILSWNAGGLAQGRLVELRLWLRQHPHDIVVLQETKWNFEACWQDDRWHYIHTATGTHRVGGLLVLINKRLIAAEHIGYEAVQPGRLLHIRLHFLRHALDLMAVYQYAEASSHAHITRRETIWKTLDEYLYEIPARNQLVCCGDFNCATEAHPPWVGTDTFTWQGGQQRGHLHRDRHRLMQILQRHSLTACNTWSAAIGPSFFHSNYAARIDYILLRLAHCDGIAKQSHYLHTADFLPLNQTHHFPLFCTIKKKQMQFHPKSFTQA